MLKKHVSKAAAGAHKNIMDYAGSFVLGLNDALVELTGALAGLTLALSNTRLIAMVGLITGIAASLAMSGSEYLSQEEEEQSNAIRAGIITGIAYFITVILLILPYLAMENKYQALVGSLIISVLIIYSFTHYTARAKGVPFGPKFRRMLLISFGAAVINFGLAFLIKSWFGIEA